MYIRSLCVKCREISRINIITFFETSLYIFPDLINLTDYLSTDRNIYNNQIKCIFDLSKLMLKRFFPVHANILINKYITTVSIHLQYFVYINAFLFFFSYNSRFTIHVPGKGLFLSIYIYIYIYKEKVLSRK